MKITGPVLTYHIAVSLYPLLKTCGEAWDGYYFLDLYFRLQLDQSCHVPKTYRSHSTGLFLFVQQQNN